jgi:hypothetical protein
MTKNELIQDFIKLYAEWYSGNKKPSKSKTALFSADLLALQKLPEENYDWQLVRRNRKSCFYKSEFSILVKNDICKFGVFKEIKK